MFEQICDVVDPGAERPRKRAPCGPTAALHELSWFQRNPLPLDWIAQRRVVDGFDA
jgi:hypothetical protein